jgi:ribosomal protein S12 methylthiotransferase accessory factor YcaO
MELIERDALAISFLTRMALPRLDLDIDAELAARAAMMKADGYDVFALDLRLDIDVPAVLVLAFRGGERPPHLLKGASVAPDLVAALRGAFGEMWRSYLHYHGARPAVPPHLADVNAGTPEYNLAFYQTPRAREWLSFLVGDHAVASADVKGSGAGSAMLPTGYGDWDLTCSTWIVRCRKLPRPDCVQ